MSDYAPVDCAQHSQYELAVLRGRPLQLSWRDAHGATTSRTVTPIDVITRAGAEFLRVRDASGVEDVRLDHITACDAPAPP